MITSCSSTSIKSEKRIIVIGAGISGIGAARTLYSAGYAPIILEARDRIGGRMKKDFLRPNLGPNGPIERDSTVVINVGANWIHGLDATVNPLYSVAQKLDLKLFQTSSDDEPGSDVILFHGDVSVSTTEYQRALERYAWLRDNFDFISTGDEMSLRESFLRAIEHSECDLGPVSETERKCFNWFFDRLSIDMGVPISNIGRATYDEGESDGRCGEAIVKGGFYQVFEHLASEYPLDIRCNHVVRHIQLPENDSAPDQTIRLQLASGEIMEADMLVVTIPVGVLQSGSISFSPRMPPQIADMCSSTKAGLMNLVWLWYPHQFWPQDYNFLGVARDDDTPVDFSTFLAPPMCDQNGVPQAVLMCQVVGDFALAIEGMADSHIAAIATAKLRAMFGSEVVPDAVGCVHSRWGTDEFSRGSWTHISNHVAIKTTRKLHSVEFDLNLLSEQLSDGENVSTDSESESEASSRQNSGDEFVLSYSDELLNESLSRCDLSKSMVAAPDNVVIIEGLQQESAAEFRCAKVFYAGEAASVQHRGTAHGAYMSGIEQAQAIIVCLEEGLRSEAASSHGVCCQSVSGDPCAIFSEKVVSSSVVSTSFAVSVGGAAN
jgi:hypothetical protein